MDYLVNIQNFVVYWNVLLIDKLMEYENQSLEAEEMAR